MNKTDKIKELLLFLLLGGKEIKEEQLLNMFTIIADLSDISNENDFSNITLNATTLFAEKSLELFLDEKYDEWIEMYKTELLKLEEYELIKDLEL